MTDVPDYPSNSHKSKTPAVKKDEKPEKDVKPVAQGVERKKSLGSKIAETFTGDDAQTVGQYILFDIMIPAAKQLIADVVTQGIERTLFGDNGRGRSGPGGRTDYNRISTGKTRLTTGSGREMSQRSRASHDFRDIMLESRAEAQEVIDRLHDLVMEYGVASVSDLYSLVNISGSFTDDKWGWYDLRSARIRPMRGGYMLDLPRTQSID